MKSLSADDQAPVVSETRRMNRLTHQLVTIGLGVLALFALTAVVLPNELIPPIVSAVILMTLMACFGGASLTNLRSKGISLSPGLNALIIILYTLIIIAIPFSVLSS